ncbi:hypothetical protein FGKAn22_16650 [Ferrigenium kumadai]|uniref:DUF5666 domain-containing protein n=1 Tax=Ferrigenium kumadai TaxID=1682490 RepID=A0AAN1SZJ6_9PROT|nr:DUF5666 domain-containing protein [Ferrigenium kumadai]BBI99972.1 hypothetical protein FGKAn22_16650 [Ferrigenium kumadai]
MSKGKALLLAVAILFGVTNALAQSQPAMRIRGAITGFDGHELQVETRSGTALKMSVTDETKISVLSPLKMSAIKQGSFVGVTAVRQGPGTSLLAREVHLFPEELRGTGEGHRDWDLEPGSTMTNANVDAIVDTNNGKELTLVYKGGSQKIIVTKGVPIITFKPADQSLLKAGAQVFIITQQAADGSLTAQRIQVGKDNMKPPM